MRLPRLSFAQRLLAGVGVVALIVAVLCRAGVANPSVFWNDDYQISILPVLADVARSWREGHWPLLSPYSWACGNLAGEYQYGTFSVFVNAVVVVVSQLPTDFACRRRRCRSSISRCWGGRVPARAGTAAAGGVGGGGGARRRAQRLENRLGRDRLVRRAGGGRVAAVVLVGVRGGDARGRHAARGTPVALSAAGAVRLSAADGRVSVHGGAAGAGDGVAGGAGAGKAAAGARCGRWRRAGCSDWCCRRRRGCRCWNIQGSHRSQGAGVGNVAWTVPLARCRVGPAELDGRPGRISPTSRPPTPRSNSPAASCRWPGLLAAFVSARPGVAGVAVGTGSAGRGVAAVHAAESGDVPVEFSLAAAVASRASRWPAHARCTCWLARRGVPVVGQRPALWATGLRGAAWLAMVARAHRQRPTRSPGDLPLWTLLVVAGWLGLPPCSRAGAVGAVRCRRWRRVASLLGHIPVHVYQPGPAEVRLRPEPGEGVRRSRPTGST